MFFKANSNLLPFQVRAATDSKLIELQKKFSSLKETNERGEKSREKLSGELKDVKKKVTLKALHPFQKAQAVFQDLAQRPNLTSKFRREALKMICRRRIRRQPNTSML